MKQNYMILIMLGVIAAIVIITQYPNIFQLGAITPIAISNVQVVDGGARILVTATAQGTDNLQITFSPDKINPLIASSGYKATKTSVLTAQYVESSKKFYWTDNPNSAVRTLQVADTGNQVWSRSSQSEYINDCINKGHPNTVAVYFTDIGTFSISNLNCVEYFNEGYVSAFNTGLGTDGFKVKFNIDGEDGYVTGDEQYISMAGGKAKISWAGSLLGINNIGAPNYDIYHVGTDWKLVDKNAYSSISSGFNNFVSCLGNGNYAGTQPTASTYNSCVATYQSIVNNNLANQNSAYVSQISNVEGITLSQGVMNVNLKQPTFKPMFTIELDASKVGLIKLTGDPVINSCIPQQSLASAGTSVGTASIKNNGNQEGYFDFQITCDNSQISGHADSLNFLAGETKSVSYQLYGGNSGTSTNSGTCTLKVTDRTSQKSVTCNYGMSIAYNPAVTECTGTETKCSGDLKTIFTCTNTKWIQTSCGTDMKCDYVNNIAKCVSTAGPPGPEPTCSWYQDGTYPNCKTSNLAYFVIAGAVIIAIVFIKQSKRRK